MAKYRLTSGGGVYNTEEGIYIPPSVDNKQWAAYLTWVGLGNIADPIHTEESPRVAGSFFPNIVVNGNFDVWQRGVAVTALYSNQYLPDRFKYKKNGDMVHSGTQSLAAPTFDESKIHSKYSYQVECTTQATTLGAGEYAAIVHTIEGYYLREIIGEVSMLSFYVKSSLTGTFSVTFTNRTDSSYVAEYTISAADTWTRIDIPVTLPAIEGMWRQDVGPGLDIMWSLGCESSLATATLDSWETGVLYGSTNQINTCETLNSTFALSQVQLIRGKSSTIFQAELIDTEVSRCQRYYEKSYALDVDPATPVDYCMAMLTTAFDKNKTIGLFFPYKVTKRATPTVFTWDAAGNPDRTTGWDKTWTRSDNVLSGTAEITPNTYGFYYIERINDARYGVVARHWAADADF